MKQPIKPLQSAPAYDYTGLPPLVQPYGWSGWSLPTKLMAASIAVFLAIAIGMAKTSAGQTSFASELGFWLGAWAVLIVLPWFCFMTFVWYQHDLGKRPWQEVRQLKQFMAANQLHWAGRVKQIPPMLLNSYPHHYYTRYGIAGYVLSGKDVTTYEHQHDISPYFNNHICFPTAVGYAPLADLPIHVFVTSNTLFVMEAVKASKSIRPVALHENFGKSVTAYTQDASATKQHEQTAAILASVLADSGQRASFEVTADELYVYCDGVAYEAASLKQLLGLLRDGLNALKKIV